MRVLHIWDEAGVAYVLAKYQQLQGHQSIVIKDVNKDKYGINTFYRNYRLNNGQYIEEAKRADIIHIHSKIDVLFHLRKQFGTSKKIILHYHGTDIRGSKRLTSRLARYVLSKRRKHILAQKLANCILVATPDLLDLVPNSVYLPNPVDIDHFNPDANLEDIKNNALTLNTEAIDIQRALDYCRKGNINLNIEVYNRIKNPIMHADMPNFLKKYKIYVDIRFVRGRLLTNLSKTALEALACGLTVLDFKLNYREGLPPDHDPVNVVTRLSSMYSK